MISFIVLCSKLDVYLIIAFNFSQFHGVFSIVPDLKLQHLSHLLCIALFWSLEQIILNLTVANFLFEFCRLEYALIAGNVKFLSHLLFPIHVIIFIHWFAHCDKSLLYGVQLTALDFVPIKTSASRSIQNVSLFRFML